MKKLVLILCAALALFSMPIGAAALDTVYVAPNYGPYQTGLGGEFSVKADATSSLSGVIGLYDAKATWQGYFQTFCLEYAEHVSANATYNYIINSSAVNGGVGPAGDPLSIGTAYLYAQFARGTLTGYNYTGIEAEREDSAALLQNAIWYLEKETGGDDNVYVNLVQGIFGEGDVINRTGGAFANNNGAYGVMALNLSRTGDPLAQDVLIYTPEPLTMLLLGIGLVGLAGLRRKE